MRRNIDAWVDALDAGAEGIVVTASACAAMVKDYAILLQDDPAYAEPARRVSLATRDIAEVLREADLTALDKPGDGLSVAFHSPCTLQHAQRLSGVVEAMLGEVGYDLVPVADGHLCCGSAGTYSILQPALSRRLLANKVSALTAGNPALLATANIGCLTHLASATELPVVHWVQLLERRPVSNSV